MVSMQTIADELNISRSTVSRILNNKIENQKYRKETIERVRKTADALGYTSNMIAKSLKMGSTKTLSFLVPDIAHPTYITFLKTLERLADEAGYSLLICATEEDVNKENNLLKMLQSRMVDGVIIAPVSYYSSLNSNYSFPLVCIDRKTKNKNYPSVLIDNRKEAYRATMKILDAGAKKPLFLAGNKADYCIINRLKGFKSALEEQKLFLADNHIIYNIYNWKDAKLKITEYIDSNGVDFDSVFFCTNYFAGSVMKVLERHNIPVICAGIDYFDVMEYQKPQIMTIVQPETEMATEAFVKLMSIINKEGKPTEDSVLDCIGTPQLRNVC